jgi:hypothetical protein
MLRQHAEGSPSDGIAERAHDAHRRASAKHADAGCGLSDRTMLLPPSCLCPRRLLAHKTRLHHVTMQDATQRHAHVFVHAVSAFMNTDETRRCSLRGQRCACERSYVRAFACARRFASIDDGTEGCPWATGRTEIEHGPRIAALRGLPVEAHRGGHVTLDALAALVAQCKIEERCAPVSQPSCGHARCGACTRSEHRGR